MELGGRLRFLFTYLRCPCGVLGGRQGECGPELCVCTPTRKRLGADVTSKGWEGKCILFLLGSPTYLPTYLEITTLTVIWARQLVSLLKSGRVPA